MANRTVAVIIDGVLKPLPDGDSLQDAGGNGVGGGLSNIVEDTTPQLGGDLDLNGNAIDFPTTANISDCLDEDDMSSNSATALATQQSIKAYCDALIAANDAMVYAGAIDCSSNPNYPAADAGDTYRVSVAGKIGGASGANVEVGDILLCNTDSTASGDHATVGAYWNIIQVNIDGAVTTTDTSAVDETIVVQDGTSGTVYKKSTKTIAEVERKRETFTQNFYLDGQNQLTGATVMDVTCPIAGYMVASSVKMKSARTAGSIAIEPHKNGTGLTPTGLDLEIDDDPTTKDNSSVTYGTSNFDVAAGDTIGFLVTTTSFTPLANVGTLTLVIESAVA